MQQTGTSTRHWINMLVLKSNIKCCQKYVEIIVYLHETIKNYRYVGDVSDDCSYGRVGVYIAGGWQWAATVWLMQTREP